MRYERAVCSKARKCWKSNVWSHALSAFAAGRIGNEELAFHHGLLAVLHSASNTTNAFFVINADTLAVQSSRIQRPSVKAVGCLTEVDKTLRRTQVKIRRTSERKKSEYLEALIE